jgi:hypothetical protein
MHPTQEDGGNRPAGSDRRHIPLIVGWSIAAILVVAVAALVLTPGAKSDDHKQDKKRDTTEPRFPRPKAPPAGGKGQPTPTPTVPPTVPVPETGPQTGPQPPTQTPQAGIDIAAVCAGTDDLPEPEVTTLDGETVYTVDVDGGAPDIIVYPPADESADFDVAYTTDGGETVVSGRCVDGEFVEGAQHHE